MIVIKIELWPGGYSTRARELGVMHITNSGGKRDDQLGNYKVKLLRRGSNKVLKTGGVENFPRKSYSVWRLVSRAIKSVFPEEK